MTNFPARRHGFTLIELTVALVISAIVLIGARAILEQLADTADRINAATIQEDRLANTDEMVRALFERTTAADSAHPFTGTPQTVRFSSWCDAPAGWTEPCTTTLSIVPDVVTRVDSSANSSTVHLVMTTSAGDSLTLRHGLVAARLRYLDDASNGGHWVFTWPAGILTPLAVGVVTPHDTTVFRIGARR